MCVIDTEHIQHINHMVKCVFKVNNKETRAMSMEVALNLILNCYLPTWNLVFFFTAFNYYFLARIICNEAKLHADPSIFFGSTHSVFCIYFLDKISIFVRETLY